MMGNEGAKPNFKELSKGTKFSTKELNEWYKKFKKDFPDGKINKTQFVDLYQKMFGADVSASAEFCEHVFRQYDRDGDGVINFNEFMTTMSVASRGTPEEKLIWAFKLYDRDGNGYLTEREVAEILTSVYRSRGQSDPVEKATKTARTILVKADDNKDGRLSEAEFIHHAMICPEIKEMLQGF